VSAIDATFPVTGSAVGKATERANWIAAKAEIDQMALWQGALAGQIVRPGKDRVADLKVSILDYVTASADRAAIRAGTYASDLTTLIHTALGQIETAGGGILYLPRGTYLCNIILGQSGRINVHLEGEHRTATRLKSFTAGGWAVYDAYAGVFPNEFTTRRSISHLSFDGGNTTRSGLLAAVNTGTDTNNVLFNLCQIGMMVASSHYGLHLNPAFRTCYVGLWMGIRDGVALTDPAVTLPSEVLAYVGHSGNHKFFAADFHNNTVGLFMGGSTGAPQVLFTGSQFEGNSVAVMSRDTSLVNTTRMFMNNTWFEANGDGTTFNALGYTSIKKGDISCGGGWLTVERVPALTNVEVVGGATLSLGAGIQLRDTPVVAAGSSLQLGRVVLDKVDLTRVATPVTTYPGRQATARTMPPQAVVPAAALPAATGAVLIRELFAGSTYVSGNTTTSSGATATFQTADSGHGIPAQTLCVQIVRATAGNCIDFNPTTIGALVGSTHVGIIGVKPTGSALSFDLWGQGLFDGIVATGSVAPADVWTWFVNIQKPASSVGTTGGFWRYSGATTFRLAGLNVLRFVEESAALAWIERYIVVG